MNIQLETTYLKVSVVHSCMIKYTPITTVVKKGFWFWEEDIVQEEKSYTLEMCYTKEDNLNYTFTSKHPDHATLKIQFDSIMKQIKDEDSQYADKLLEDAIIGGGTK